MALDRGLWPEESPVYSLHTKYLKIAPTLPPLPPLLSLHSPAEVLFSPVIPRNLLFEISKLFSRSSLQWILNMSLKTNKSWSTARFRSIPSQPITVVWLGLKLVCWFPFISTHSQNIKSNKLNIVRFSATLSTTPNDKQQNLWLLAYQHRPLPEFPCTVYNGPVNVHGHPGLIQGISLECMSTRSVFALHHR